MKRKALKVVGLLTIAGTAEETQAHHPPIDDSQANMEDGSWLMSSLAPDRELLLCQSRLLCSEIFLQSVLYPLLDKVVDFDEEQLIDLLITYKKASPGPGRDFECANILGSILNHMQCTSVPNEKNAFHRSAVFDKDLALLDILSEMDMRAVDTAVLDRLEGA